MTHIVRPRSESPTRRSFLSAVAAVPAVVALAGCGDSGGDDSSGGSKGKITIASGSANAVFAQLYLAKELGYFDDASVDVKIVESGSNALNMVASGGADLGMSGISGPLLLAQQGKKTTIVYSPQAGAAAGMLVGGKGVTTIKDLKGKRIGSLAKGTSTYGYAAYYNDKFGLGADIVPMQNNAAITAALKSGQVAGATGPFSSYSTLVDAGDAKILVDIDDQAVRRKIIGPDTPEGSVFGQTANLDKKRDAVVAVLVAFGRALAYFEDHSDEDVAKVLLKNPGFSASSLEVLAPQVKSARTHVGKTQGRVTEKIWPSVLADIDRWGLTDFDPDEPDFAYKERVDMSYLDAAGDEGK